MVWPFPANDPVLSPAVEQIYENLFRILSDEAEQIAEYPEPLRTLMIKGSDGDENIGAYGPFGTSATNPIPVNGPIGQLLYLSSLRINDQRILFHRLGSVQNVDIFECVNVKGTNWKLLYLDMYHPRKSRRAPEGFSIATDNVLLSGVTYQVADFPNSLYSGIVDYSETRFGISIADPLIRVVLERNNFTRPSHHLECLLENQGRLVSVERNIIQELVSATTDAQHQLYETLMKFHNLEVGGVGQLPMVEIVLTEIAFLPIAMAVRSLFQWYEGDPSGLADKICENVLRKNIESGSLEMTMPEAANALEIGFPKYQELLLMMHDDQAAFAMQLSRLLLTKQNYLIGMALAAICGIILKAMKLVIQESVSTRVTNVSSK